MSFISIPTFGFVLLNNTSRSFSFFKNSFALLQISWKTLIHTVFLLLTARLTHSWQIAFVLSVLLLQLALLYLTNWFQYVSYCLHFEFFQPILSFPDPSTKLTHGISWISLFLQYYCIILFESSNNIQKKRTSLSWCSLTVVPSKLHTVNTFFFPKPLP